MNINNGAFRISNLHADRCKRSARPETYDKIVQKSLLSDAFSSGYSGDVGSRRLNEPARTSLIRRFAFVSRHAVMLGRA